MNSYLEYRLEADILSIGERTKKGTFKPCVKTIPFPTITGALRDKFGLPNILAVGKFTQDYLNKLDEFRDVHTYSPRYIYEGVSKIPLKIEFLTNVKGLVYILLQDDKALEWCKQNPEFDICMGAFKSKGFGECHLSYAKTIEKPEIKTGFLQSRIPENYLSHFCIEEVHKPIYGYLFEPENVVTGKYVISIFEGSLVTGCSFLIEEVEENARA